jgi:mRNA-degrading endonuclease toxin of MazEF toxin-antitoxin module
MPLLVFVKRGKRLGEFLTIPYTLIDEVLSLSDVPAYVSPIKVTGVSAVLLTPAQVQHISVSNTDKFLSDSAVLVKAILTSNTDEFDAYLAMLPTDTVAPNDDVQFSCTSVLVDEDILRNLDIDTTFTPIYPIAFQKTQGELDASDMPVVARQVVAYNPTVKIASVPVVAKSETATQKEADSSNTPIAPELEVYVGDNVKHSLTPADIEHREVTYTLFWLPPVPILIGTSVYDNEPKSRTDEAVVCALLQTQSDVDSTTLTSMQYKAYQYVSDVKYVKLTPIVPVPKQFSTALSLKVIFPEAGAVASEAYAASLVLSIQRDTSAVSASNMASEYLVLSLSTTTNPVSSTATA